MTGSDLKRQAVGTISTVSRGCLSALLAIQLTRSLATVKR
jgi:hypothetical protein